jgi:hypothetical protein
VEIVIVVSAGLLTLLLAGALAYWIGREWRERRGALPGAPDARDSSTARQETKQADRSRPGHTPKG